jgi:hypothetical protein
MKIGTVISSKINNLFRSIKSSTLGSNRETGDFVSPGGIDFKPVPNMKALYISTANSSEPVCVGYINKTIMDDLNEGEQAFFATDGESPLSFIKARKNGDIEINGNEDFAVRFKKLKEEYDKTKAVVDAIISVLSPPITEPGNNTPSAFQAAMKAAVGIKQTGDISAAKVDTIRLP